jgi:hypothetical protein
MSEPETTEVKRGPGRPPRQEEVKTQRRRRDSLDADRNLKLHVPEEAKDPNFHYRWIKNNPGRVQQITQQDDYDLVTAETLASQSLGTQVQRASNKTDGESVVLVRKPLKFYEEDKAKEAKRIDATEESMRRAPPASSEGLSGSEAYVPGGKDARNIVNGR